MSAEIICIVAARAKLVKRVRTEPAADHQAADADHAAEAAEWARYFNLPAAQ